MSHQQEYLWNAVAVSGTTVYKSGVIDPMDDEHVFCAERTTSTAVGVLSLEANYLTDDEYRLAVNAAAGVTNEAREAANTSGWQQFDMSPDATVAVTAGMQNTFQLRQPLPHKLRFSYANSSGSGAITMTARKAKR